MTDATVSARIELAGLPPLLWRLINDLAADDGRQHFDLVNVSGLNFCQVFGKNHKIC